MPAEERRALAKQLRAALPEELLDDPRADWRRAPNLLKVLRWRTSGREAS